MNRIYIPRRQGNKKKKNSDSIILSLLCRMYMFIRNSFSHSIFSMLICGFADREEKFENGFIVSLFKDSPAAALVKKYQNRILGIYEQSCVNKYINLELHRLLTRSGRDYGIFFAFSGIYITVAYIVNRFVRAEATADEGYLIAALIMFAISTLFIFSKGSFSTVICRNRILNFLAFDILGAKKRTLYERPAEISNPSIPLLLGIILGVLCMLFSPVTLLKTLLVIFICVLIMIKTEIGLLAVLASLPLYGKEITVIFSVVTFTSYISKILRNKRSFKFEFSDLFIALATVLGVFVSLIPAVKVPLTAFELISCLLLYFAIKNTVRSWITVKQSISVQVFIFFGICAYYVLTVLLSGSVFTSSILPTELSNVFSHSETVAMLVICLMPYLLVSLKGAGRKRDKMSLLVVMLSGIYTVLSLYSYGAVVCMIICFTAFMLTYSPDTFSAFAVLSAPVSLVIWLLIRLTPDFSLTALIQPAYNSAFDVAVGAYGIFWMVFMLLAVVSFLGYMMSYTNEYYNEYIHKRRMSKMISAPMYSVISLMICSVLMSGVDTFTVFVFFYSQTALGMSMTAYAREQDRIEREWFTGGVRK